MANSQTEYVPRRSAEGAFHARRFAGDVGVAFTAMVTVSWSHIGAEPRELYDLHKTLRARFKRAWKYRQRSTALPELHMIETIESPEGDFHAHALVNVLLGEREWVLQTLISRMSKITGQEVPEDAIQILDVQHSGTVLKYMLKGVSPAYADYFHMRTLAQGTVHGRRVSVSRSLGPTARRRARWRRTGR